MFDGASGSQTVNSGGTAAGKQFYNVIINNTGTSVQLNTNGLTQAAGGALSFTQGALDLNGLTWTLGADFTPAPTAAAVLDVSTNGGSVFTGASSYDIILSDADMALTQGTGTVTCRDYSQTLGTHTLSGALNTRGFSRTGGTFTCSGTSAINASGDVILTSSWTNTGNTLTMSGASKTINANQALNNLTIADGASVSITTNGLNVGGNLAIGQGTSGSLDTNSRHLSVIGTTAINSGATLNLDATSAASSLTITDTLTNSGTLTLEDDTNLLSIIGSGAVRTFTGNDIDYNTNSVTLTNIDYDPDVLLDEAGDTIVLGDSNCVFDAISIGAGSVASTFNAGAYNFALSGSFTNTAAGTFTSTGTVTFNGASDQTLTPGGTDANHDFNNITHTGAGNLILGGAIDIDGILTQNNASSDIDPSASNYTITAGSLTLTTGTINNSSRIGTWDISGNVTISSGTLKAPATITVGGDWSNAGTFTHNSGAVVFNGASASAISGDTLFYNFTCIIAGKTLNFGAGDTQTVTGIFTLTGASGNFLSLRSTSSPTQWRIDPQGTRNVSCVDVKDSNNINASAIVPVNSVSSGNNTNWTFGKDFSGTVYSDKGLTPIGAGKTVAIAINGGAAVKTAVTDSTGQYVLSGVDIAAGDVVIVYLDGNVEKGSTVSVVAKENFSGVDIYQNTVIVRYDDTAGYTTNANLATADNGDADIKYSVVDSALVLESGQELFIWLGDTYQPGGDVTTTHMDIRGTVTAGNNTFTISGNWFNSGTFTYDTSTVIFNDSSRASVISGSTTFYNLTSTTPAKILTFTRDTTQTVTKRITLTGAATDTAVINDAGSGVIPKLTVESGAVQAITNVRVTNNDASSGIQLVAQGAGSVLSGDTPNWILGSAGARFIWSGSVSSDWGDPLNWDLGLTPSSTSIVTVPGGTPHQPRLDISRTVNTFEVDASATFDTGNQAFFVLNHFVLDGTLNAGFSTVTVSGNMTTSGEGVIQGTSPTLAVSGYIGTKDAPLDLSVTGTAVISAASMGGMVSVSINGTGQIDYSASIPGFVYVNGQVDDKAGQSQIRSILQTGISWMYAAPVSSSGFNSLSGFVPAPAVLAGVLSAPVMVPVATPVFGASLMPAPVVSSVVESPVALVASQAPAVSVVEPVVVSPSVVPQPSFENVCAQVIVPQQVSFDGVSSFSTSRAQTYDFKGVVSQFISQPMAAQRDFSSVVSQAQLAVPEVFYEARGAVQLPQAREGAFDSVMSQASLLETLGKPVFEGIIAQAVFPEPVVFEVLLKEVIISTALPEVVSKEFFRDVALETVLPNVTSFEGIRVTTILPGTLVQGVIKGMEPQARLPQNLQDSFIGVKSEVVLMRPVTQEGFKGVISGASLSDQVSFEGIGSGVVLPQPFIKPLFEGINAGVNLPLAAPVNEAVFEKTKAEANLSGSVNPQIFSDMAGEMKVKVVFPGGQQIMSVHGIGVPLGAERPLLESKVKAQEED